MATFRARLTVAYGFALVGALVAFAAAMYVARSARALQELGPVLLGTSRKAFLGALLDGREPKGRDAATTALSVLAAQAGCWGVRVHDVTGTADAFAVLERMGS